MDIFLPLLLLMVQIFLQSYALSCHLCSHRNSKEASRLQLHDRVQSTPEECEEKHVCEGNWCTQTLVGGNVNFGCSEHSPIEYIWEAKDISSHCSAYYDINGISHATCWCRTDNFCNLSYRPNNTNLLCIFGVLFFYLITT